jgi:hypothetical protein
MVKAMNFKTSGIEVTFNGITFLPNLMKIHQLVQKLLGRDTDRHTGNLTRLLSFLNESRLKCSIVESETVFMLERDEANDKGNIGNMATLSIEQCEQLRRVIKFFKFLFKQFQIFIKETFTSLELEALDKFPPPETPRVLMCILNAMSCQQ